MILQPAAGFVAGLESNNCTTIRHALQHADCGTLTLGGESFSPWPGEKSRKRALRYLTLLAPIQIETMYVAKTWLAANGRNLLVVKFRLDKHLRTLLDRTEIWRTPYEKWEDLALFREGKLMFWSCTHDQDIVISESDSWLLAHGLLPRPAETMCLDVQEVDAESVNQIRKYLSAIHR